MDLARAVLSDPEVYSSRVRKRTTPPDEVRDEVTRLRAARLATSPMLSNDPPEHDTYRRMVNKAFTPRALGWMEGRVRAVATDLATALPDEADFVERFAIPLPVFVISEVLGLDEAHRGSVRRWTSAMTGTIGGSADGSEWIAAERDLAEFEAVLMDECRRRRERPGEDLLTGLVRAVDAAEPADDERSAVLIGLVRQLLAAGNETTTRLLAEGMALLAAHPLEWDRLRRTPDRAEPLVEEMARLASPIQQMLRRVTRDVTVAGVRLPAEATVLVSFASANRDESVFPDPDRFAPDRTGLRRQLAFGHGIHACVGAALARMEARIALEVLAERTRGIEVVDHEPRYLSSFLLRGRTSLPVRVRR
ncbi:cytochrome P450 [Spirillospora sp. NPDC048911]|uniref:cytochrome P450 n=1 Tax=Spirillospora sp. NPDC048911 TaxID=3364527 RepID=UPI003711E7D1